MKDEFSSDGRMTLREKVDVVYASLTSTGSVNECYIEDTNLAGFGQGRNVTFLGCKMGMWYDCLARARGV